MFAALYPGQGSQSVGMGRFLFDNFKVAKGLFEEASDTLHLDLKKLCFEGPESDLALTANTQPVLLLVSVATFQSVLDATGKTPAVAAGHSIGEYAACVNAQAMVFGDALKAVRARGLAMQSAVPPGQGAMAAVMGLTPDQTGRICAWATSESGMGPLEPANFNAPGQIVISGSQKTLEWLMQNFNKDHFAAEGVTRVKFIPLKVSAPFHCSMMQPAEQEMQKVLSDMKFKNAAHPIAQNFTAALVTDGSTLRTNLVRQVSGPVRWIECIEQVNTLTPRFYVEYGHGQVLKGLLKKIDPAKEVFNVNSLEEFRHLEEVFKGE
jgi:[acyl-carrier-protein] S-malonyltransferase